LKQLVDLVPLLFLVVAPEELVVVEQRLPEALVEEVVVMVVPELQLKMVVVAVPVDMPETVV
jgi:hypothetical protein